MFNTMDSLWTDAVETLLERGDIRESRVGKVKEIGPFITSLSNISQSFLLNKRRKLSPSYAAAETIWYLSSRDDVKMISAYAPQYVNYCNDGIAHGAYGRRIASNTHENQFALLIKHLSQEPNSRQAVITLWNADDLWHTVNDKKKDLPCTLSMQFLIRDNALHMITTMRSNDVWLGLPYDIFAFTCFQRLIASALKIQPGTYTHQVGSMHLYERNWKAAKDAVQEVHYPNHYRRLEHEWGIAISKDWQDDICDTIQAEEQIRKHDDVIRFPLSPMLLDLVACCSTKWNQNLLPVSPMLREGLNNAKAK